MLHVPSMEGLGHAAEPRELLVHRQRDLSDGDGTIVTTSAPNSTPLLRRRPRTDQRLLSTEREAPPAIEMDSDCLSWHLACLDTQTVMLGFSSVLRDGCHPANSRMARLSNGDAEARHC